jgi:hypothetical protein
VLERETGGVDSVVVGAVSVAVVDVMGLEKDDIVDIFYYTKI